VELYISPNGKDVVLWWQEQPGTPASRTWHVPQASVATRSRDVRQVLKELNDYLRTNPRLHEERDPSWEKYLAIVNELKERGRSLHRVLFQYPERPPPAHELEMAIENLGRDDELIVHCPDDAVTFPLGFVCAPLPDDADDAGGAAEAPALTRPDRADFDGCWVNRFDITMLLNGAGCGLHIERESLRTVYALDAVAIERAIEELAAASLENEIECFLTLSALEIGKRNQWALVRKACAQLADFNGVIFVLAHTQDGDLYLADTDARIDCLDFADLIRQRLRYDRSKLLILNCCASAVGAEGNSLLGAVADKGFCGLIGTEAEILNTGALRCGSRLLWEIYFNGKSLGAAFRAMQDAADLFPLNLFYTCYAQRGFHLDRPLERKSTHEQDAAVRPGAP
jgi:hypothetical protein